MTQISTIKTLLDQWPTRKELAAEIDCGVDRVHKWAQTGAIPARFHARILRAAAGRGIAINAQLLADLHDRPSEAA